MSFPKQKMTDRRNKSAIRNIVWHYTATTHGGIKAHENYWKNTQVGVSGYQHNKGDK